MLIAYRNGMMTGGKRLPYDAEVEYLESVPTNQGDNFEAQCYIDSGVRAKTGYTITASVIDTTPNANGGICAAVGAGGARLHYLMIWPTNTGLIGYGSNWNNYRYPYNKGAEHIWTAEFLSGRQTITIDGNVVKSTNWAGTLSVEGNLFIFAVNSLNSQSYTARYQGAWKLRWLTIREGDTLLRDFISVRVGTTGELYDRVSGKLFRNQGTGAFVIGPDKASSTGGV